MAGDDEMLLRDDRTLRLFDLAPYEAVVIRCECGRIVEYRRGLLERRYRIPSDTLVYDLRYRLRCRQCNRIEGFRISVLDRRNIGDRSMPVEERVVVGGGDE